MLFQEGFDKPLDLVGVVWEPFRRLSPVNCPPAVGL